MDLRKRTNSNRRKEEVNKKKKTEEKRKRDRHTEFNRWRCEMRNRLAKINLP